VKKMTICLGIAILAALCMVSWTPPAAGAVIPELGGPGMGAGLVFSGTLVMDASGNPVYRMNDDITMVLSVSNIGIGDVITSRGWADTPFHLYLEFKGPDGKIITSPLIAGTLIGHPQDPSAANVHVPPPLQIEVNGAYVQVERVEVLSGSTPGPVFTKSTSIPGVRSYYPIPEPDANGSPLAGRYSVRAVIPMVAYPPALYFQGGAYYAPIGENIQGNWEGTVVSSTLYFTLTEDKDLDGFYTPVNPITPAGGTTDCDDNNPGIHPNAQTPPNPLPGVDYNCDGIPDTAGAAPAIFNVLAETQKVGSGTYPSSTKEPIAGMPVKVISTAQGSCAAGYGISWDKYWLIYSNCPGTTGTTNSAGKVDITVPPGDYVIIGPYLRTDNTYMADTAVGVVAGQTYARYLLLMNVTGSGKHIPGKYIKKTGSELLVIEPEFVEWTSAQELYPFVFRSIGDWSITTTIDPPKGFVTDYQDLVAEVNSDTKAVQFTVTDVGSDWVDTKVEFKIKHNKNTEIVKDKIGVKKGKGAKP